MSPLIREVEAKPRGVAVVTLAGDGEEPDSTCLLPLESVVMHHLRSGATVDDGEWRRLLVEGQQMLATRRGLDLLSRRMRTEQELRRSLARHYEEAAVDGAIERLREVGYLDDASWAEHYVGSYRAADRGRALLRQEMRQRGVHDETAAAALDAHDDVEAAHVAARKRARSLRRVAPDLRRRRLYDHLRRRGFRDGVARQAMEAALAGLDDGDDLDGDDVEAREPESDE